MFVVYFFNFVNNYVCIYQVCCEKLKKKNECYDCMTLTKFTKVGLDK